MRAQLALALAFVLGAGCGGEIGGGTASDGGQADGSTPLTADGGLPDADPGPDADLRPACVEGDLRATNPDNGNCYFLTYSAPQDWVSAKQTCADAGAYLAVITGSEENKIAVQLAQDAHAASAGAVVDYWIGATDSATEGTFVWDQTGLAVDYSNWRQDPLEPNDGGAGSTLGEDCTIIEGDTALGTWDDRYCETDAELGVNRDYGFLCER